MKIVLDRGEMRAYEARHIESGVPSFSLMDAAGTNAARLIADWLEGEWAPFAEGTIVVVAGTGNNGGDGFVVARELETAGYRVALVVVGTEERLSDDARRALESAFDVDVTWTENVDVLSAILEEASVVVDALFGTGLSRPLEGVHLEAVRAINEVPAHVVAIDLPSGLDADTGAVLGDVIRADRTITMAYWKRGLATPRGAASAGDVHVAEIGVPLDATSRVGLFDAEDAVASLSPRGPLSYKGSSGHVLILAGSPGKGGAALLAARGAYRGGAGLVTLGTTTEVGAAALASLPEVMCEPTFGEDAWRLFEKKGAVVVGPGLGLDARGRAILRAVLTRFTGPVIVDADGLTLLPDEHGARAAGQTLVLTPHPGEAARLMDTTIASVEADRFGTASALAKRFNAWVVLKGAHSIAASPDGDLTLSGRGSPVLGVAGSGDVLAGLLGALSASHPISLGLPLGLTLHAEAGTIAASLRGALDRGILASEIADALPHAIARYL